MIGQRFTRRGGLQDSAQGFNPGFNGPRRCAPKVAPERGLSLPVVVAKRVACTSYTVWRHFQGAFFWYHDPGLKPWSESCNRFALDYMGPAHSPGDALPTRLLAPRFQLLAP